MSPPIPVADTANQSMHRRQPALGELLLDWRRQEEVEKLMSAFALWGVGDDDCALFDGWVEVSGDDKIVANGREMLGLGRG